MSGELRRFVALCDLCRALGEAHDAAARMAALQVRDCDRVVADDLAVLYASAAAERRREAERLGVPL